MSSTADELFQNLRARIAFAIAGGGRAKDDRQRIIRRILRRFPLWIDGHLALAEAALDSMRRGKIALGEVERTLSTAELSARVVMRKSGPDADSFRIAKGYLAVIRFHRKEFTEALQELKKILNEESSTPLNRDNNLIFREAALLAALAVGDKTEAVLQLGNIPESERPGDVHLLLK